MNKYIGFLLLCGFLMTFDNLQGQDSLEQVQELELLEGDFEDIPANKLRLYNAYNSAKELKNGTLIVLLRSESKRLSQLEILSRSDEYSESQQKGILKKIKNIKQETRFVNQALIEGFQTRYAFSDVYFAYDTSLTSIQNGIRTNIFVGESGFIDESIEVETDYIYFCKYGLISTSQQKEGLTLMNSENQKLRKPFPTISVAGSSGALLILNLFTNDEIYAKRSIGKDIEKLERRLFDLIRRGDESFDEKQP